jgi:hypothetical protein
VSISTTSVHLFRLEAAHLVTAHRKGRNCYYRLRGAHVEGALQALRALAAETQCPPAPGAINAIPVVRRCYDHMGGSVAVALHDCFRERGWLLTAAGTARAYELSSDGAAAFQSLGIEIEAVRSWRRTFAHGCPDWREGKYHLGGALGAAFMSLARSRNWVVQDPDHRTLRISRSGSRELSARWDVCD